MSEQLERILFDPAWSLQNSSAQSRPLDLLGLFAWSIFSHGPNGRSPLMSRSFGQPREAG